MGRKKIWVSAYTGGKIKHLHKLIPLLPSSYHYCEPYGGLGSVLLNRLQSPIETLNDINMNIINFLRVLRNRTNEFIDYISLVPYSRKEFNDSTEILNASPDDNDEFTRAVAFFVCARQSRGGCGINGTWAMSTTTSRRGMSKEVSGMKGSIAMLSDVAERLLMVQLECRPALEVLKLYDSHMTLFYCDPPYPHESRTGNLYPNEMSDDDHRELAAVLNKAKGRVVISGYKCDLMDELYGDWETHFWITRSTIAKMTSMRLEGVWRNFSESDPPPI
jgi:DNA adenine methylase